MIQNNKHYELIKHTNISDYFDKLKKWNVVSRSVNDFSKYIEEPWTIIESYFKVLLEKLVRHQLESYNDFITYQIQKTIDMFNRFNSFRTRLR